MGEVRFVLVGGWPGSGKTTLAQALAPELGLGYLGKDVLKEQLMAELGDPADVEASRRLGATAARVLLRLAAGLPGAVLDSTWYDYARPLVDALPGVTVEVRCLVPRALAEERYRARRRGAGHLDDLRSPDELWRGPVHPLGVGPLIEVDTSAAVDVVRLARQIREAR